MTRVSYILIYYFVFLILLMSLSVQAEKNLLLTGETISLHRQLITVPKTDNWQMQIKWLAQDGQMVAKESPVVTFDGSLIQARLNTIEEQLSVGRQALLLFEMELNEQILDAKNKLEISQMYVEFGEIEAGIESIELSKLERSEFNLFLREKVFEQKTFQADFAHSNVQAAVELRKKQLELAKLEEEALYLKEQIVLMTVRAEHTGPANIYMHPLSGERIDMGMSLQAGWAVMDIQTLEGFYIQSWVHAHDVYSLNEGDVASIIFDAFPDQEYEAILFKKATQTEKRTQWSDSSYFLLKFRLKTKAQFTVLPGMSARIMVQYDS